MKRRNEAGFSLVEVLVAITILAAVVLPICSALAMSVRMNERADKLMRAQLAVSSAAETLMAEGIPDGTENGPYGADRFREVDITISNEEMDGETVVILPYYNVKVSSKDGLVTVTTTVAPEPPSEETSEADSSTEPTGEEGTS